MINKAFVKTQIVLLYFLLLYFFIYNPIISQISSIQQLLFFSTFFIILALNRRETEKLIQFFKKEILISFILVIYVIFLVLTGSDSLILIQTIKQFLFSWVGCFSLVILHNKLFQSKCFFNSLIKIGLIAALITLILLISPSINDFLNSYMAYSEVTADLEIVRGFGFAEGLTFSYGIIQGVIASLCLQIKKESFAKYGSILILLISVAFSARTGLLIFLFSFFFCLIIQRRIAILYSFLMISLAVFLLLTSGGLYDKYESTFDWMLEMFYMFSDLILGTELGPQFNHFDGLMESFIIYPETISQWIFGRGEYIFIHPSLHSDIGFILQLNYGGILFVVTIYVLFLMMFYRLYKYNKSYWFSYLLMVTLVLSNWKGDVIYQGGVFRFCLLCYICFCSRFKEKKFVYE